MIEPKTLAFLCLLFVLVAMAAAAIGMRLHNAGRRHRYAGYYDRSTRYPSRR